MFDAKGGEGSSMLDLGGATYLGGAYLSYLVFMCDTLCIHVYYYALNYLSVIVIVILM